MKRLQEFGFRDSSYERPNQKWVCGRLASGNPCRVGPDGRGNCQASFECEPAKSGDTWQCTRALSGGGACEAGPRPDGTCCRAIPPCTPELSIRAKRGWFAKWAAALCVGFVALIVTYTGDTRLLVPGPMTASHSSLSNCAVCHSNVPEGQFGWLHTIFAPTDPNKTSEACLTCHSMAETALNPHGLALDELEKRTKRLRSAAASTQAPMSLRVSKAVLPVDGALADGVFCTACHKEHQGERVDLTALSDAQCQTCHAVQFDSFVNGHPKFSDYPFDRRTRISFDHSSHFTRHFPDTLKKSDTPKSVPGVCADCHATGPQRRLMLVRTFERMCSSCHIGQITGAEAASGPRGVGLLTLPGLDVESLRAAEAKIGEWPAEPFDLETEITPLMKLLIGSDAEGKKLLADVSAIYLLELEQASPEDIATVERFVWAVKDLVYRFSTSMMSETQAIQNLATPGQGEKPDRALLAKLTASIPRDVWLGAQRDWFPNLPSEMELRRSGAAVPMPAPDGEAPTQDDGTDASPGDQADDGGEQPSDVLAEDDDSVLNDDDGDVLAEDEDDVLSDEDADVLAEDDDSVLEEDGSDVLAEDDDSVLTDDSTDDQTAEDDQTSDATQTAEVNAEDWAEFGGWYRHNYAIRYKPADHADPFMKAWLDYTGALVGKPEKSIAAPVFEALTGKFAPGQCAKCHSVDARADDTRAVNWNPVSVTDKRGLFTRFSHEPHFGILDATGCLTCHTLNPAADYQSSYKSQDPAVFSSNFTPVSQDFCASCHIKSEVGDDCQLCHSYHVNGIDTRNMATTTKAE